VTIDSYDSSIFITHAPADLKAVIFEERNQAIQGSNHGAKSGHAITLLTAIFMDRPGVR
jgi:hypothetical protein